MKFFEIILLLFWIIWILVLLGIALIGGFYLGMYLFL